MRPMYRSDIAHKATIVVCSLWPPLASTGLLGPSAHWSGSMTSPTVATT